MSTIKVSNIQNASASSAAITLDANGQATLNGLNYPTAGPLSNRNLIINGAMQIAQRGTQVTGNTSGGYLTCDRFRPTISSLGTWTVDQSTDAPNGFSNSLKLTCTTADASPAAGDSALIRYLPEGQDLQHLSFGTADAKSFVVSFWVKSNKTGAASLSIIQVDDSNRFVSPTYTINSADTWEYKTIVIPGNTNSEIDSDNTIGLYIDWHLNSGSNFSSGTNRTTWSTYASADLNASNLGVGGATSDYFAITGVQLEVGSVATPFEHRSYGDELRRCQRYCQTLGGAEYNQILLVAYKNVVRVEGAIKHVVQMRTGPSVTTTGTGDFTADKGGSTFATDLVFQSVITAETNQDVTFVDFSPGTSVSGSDGQCGFLYNNASSTRKLILSAEL